MSQKEILLDKEEIKTILLGIRNNPQLQLPNIVTMMKCGRDFATVYWISNNKGLIWIKGNEDTGLEHISNRHDWSSTRQYWRIDQTEKLDNPSRFSPEVYPIKHFDRIAEDIFNKENLNIDKNKKPEVFDVYEGESSYYPDGEKMKFRLIAYKDTSIVHTLIPLKGEKKIMVNLKRGNCQGKITQDNNELLYLIGVPYRNQKGEAIFSFQIIYNITKREEKAYIININTNKNWTIYERKIEKVLPIDEIIQGVQLMELVEVEKFINKQMKNSKKN